MVKVAAHKVREKYFNNVCALVVYLMMLSVVQTMQHRIEQSGRIAFNLLALSIAFVFLQCDVSESVSVSILRHEEPNVNGLNEPISITGPDLSSDDQPNPWNCQWMIIFPGSVKQDQPMYRGHLLRDYGQQLVDIVRELHCSQLLLLTQHQQCWQLT
jgi:hypothetical protein